MSERNRNSKENARGYFPSLYHSTITVPRAADHLEQLPPGVPTTVGMGQKRKAATSTKGYAKSGICAISCQLPELESSEAVSRP